MDSGPPPPVSPCFPWALGSNSPPLTISPSILKASQAPASSPHLLFLCVLTARWPQLPPGAQTPATIWEPPCPTHDSSDGSLPLPPLGACGCPCFTPTSSTRTMAVVQTLCPQGWVSARPPTHPQNRDCDHAVPAEDHRWLPVLLHLNLDPASDTPARGRLCLSPQRLKALHVLFLLRGIPAPTASWTRLSWRADPRSS